MHKVHTHNAYPMRKTERVSFKLTPSEQYALRQLAKAEGEQMSVVLRRLIREACIIHGIKIDDRNGNHSDPDSRLPS